MITPNQPKSLCRCGHTGDGPGSVHLDILTQPGHGACIYQGCKCRKFTWREYTLHGHALKRKKGGDQ